MKGLRWNIGRVVAFFAFASLVVWARPEWLAVIAWCEGALLVGLLAAWAWTMRNTHEHFTAVIQGAAAERKERADRCPYCRRKAS